MKRTLTIFGIFMAVVGMWLGFHGDLLMGIVFVALGILFITDWKSI